MITTTEKQVLTSEVTINAPVKKVWDLFTDPKHIVRWNYASDDWHTPRAENDIRVGGKFLWRMEARDGSMGFDFHGEYTEIDPYKFIEYTLGDGRKVQVSFFSEDNNTMVTENFEAEETHSLEMQKEGWQSILNNFKKYVEASEKLERVHLETQINAPVEKVYQTMIAENTYNEWTSEFNSSSHFKGSWEKGSIIKFLGADQDGRIGGMIARIRENIPNRFISIEHFGMIENGEEKTTGPEIENWAGALENYTFSDVNGQTLLNVDVDINQEYMSYFETTWPKALNKLKEICER